MAVYVVFEPAESRGMYATWPECQAKVAGVSGAKFQKVATRELAESMLAGERKPLRDGLYAVVDGNHAGWCGIVWVEVTKGQDTILSARATHIAAIFPDGIPTVLGIQTIPTDMALNAIRNVAAELAAAYQAISEAAPGSMFTLVYDYEGVGQWLKGLWQIKNAMVLSLVDAIANRIREKDLLVDYLHQRGHQADRMGLDVLATANAKADELATQGAQRVTPDVPVRTPAFAERVRQILAEYEAGTQDADGLATLLLHAAAGHLGVSGTLAAQPAPHAVQNTAV